LFRTIGRGTGKLTRTVLPQANAYAMIHRRAAAAGRDLRSAHMKITAAVVPVRSSPFEIETLDLAAPLADEVLVRVVASGMCHTDLHARDGYFPNLP
jgi:hypothetical protein